MKENEMFILREDAQGKTKLGLWYTNRKNHSDITAKIGEQMNAGAEEQFGADRLYIYNPVTEEKIPTTIAELREMTATYDYGNGLEL